MTLSMQLLLSSEDFTMKELELVRLTYRWCLPNQTRLVDFSEYFDFSRLSDKEKAWILSQLPISMEPPKLGIERVYCLRIWLPRLTSIRTGSTAPLYTRNVLSTRFKIGWELFSKTQRGYSRISTRSRTILRVDRRLTLANCVPKRDLKGTRFSGR